MKTRLPLIANFGFKGAQEYCGMRASFIAGVGIDLLTRGRRACWALLSGATVYVLGVVVVTLMGHAPLDSALLALDTASLPSDAWLRYATPWLGNNNLRALAAGVAAVCFVVAMLRR